MTLDTYGTHQENVADALHALLLAPTPHPDPADHPDLQLLRDQVRAGLLARLETLGRGHRVSPRLSAGPRVDPGSIRGRGLHLVHRILADHPASPALSVPPSDTLTGGRNHPVLENWRRTGAGLLLGNHILEDTVSRWHQDLRVLGTATADVAEVVEAFVILDGRLAATGALHRDQVAPQPVWDERGQRAICATIARESHWLTDPRNRTNVDDIRPIASATALGGAKVSADWRSLSDAVLRLAAMSQPLGRDLAPDASQRLSVTHIRGVLLLQAQLCALVARHAVQIPGAKELRVGAHHRAVVLIHAVNQARSWVDMDRVLPLAAMREQAHHLSTAIHESVGWAKPTLEDLARLDDSIASTSRAVALALRSDLSEHRPRYAQRLSPTVAQLAPTDVTDTNLYRACDRVIALPQHDPTERAPGLGPTPDTARSQLRTTLAASPTKLQGRAFQLLDYGGHPQHAPTHKRNPGR